MQFKMEHVLPATAELSWNTVMDDAFSNASYANSGTKREIISTEERNGLVFMKLKIVVEKELPPMAAKVIGASTLSWVQEQVVDHDKKLMKWKIDIPGVKKVDASGIFQIVEKGEQALRIVEGNIQVKIPIVGKKAEKHICRQLEESYEKSARFTQEWLKGK